MSSSFATVASPPRPIHPAPVRGRVTTAPRSAPPPLPHFLLNGARHPATSPAPGAVAVPVPATTAPWTRPRPARRALCSRAYHPTLTPALLYWGGGTVGRFRTATDLPGKIDVLVHGYKTSVTAICSRLARGGLRTHTAVKTTRAGRAPHEDRRAPHTVLLSAPRDGRRAHDKVHVGGVP